MSHVFHFKNKPFYLLSALSLTVPLDSEDKNKKDDNFNITLHFSTALGKHILTLIYSVSATFSSYFLLLTEL